MRTAHRINSTYYICSTVHSHFYLRILRTLIYWFWTLFFVSVSSFASSDFFLLLRLFVDSVRSHFEYESNWLLFIGVVVFALDQWAICDKGYNFFVFTTRRPPAISLSSLHRSCLLLWIYSCVQLMIKHFKLTANKWCGVCAFHTLFVPDSWITHFHFQINYLILPSFPLHSGLHNLNKALIYIIWL